MLGWFVLVAWLGAGLPRLVFDNDYRMFFGPDNPQLLEFEKMQNTFNKNDNILFVITPKDGRVFTVDTLSAVTDLTTGSASAASSIKPIGLNPVACPVSSSRRE